MAHWLTPLILTLEWKWTGSRFIPLCSSWRVGWILLPDILLTFSLLFSCVFVMSINRYLKWEKGRAIQESRLSSVRDSYDNFGRDQWKNIFWRRIDEESSTSYLSFILFITSLITSLIVFVMTREERTWEEKTWEERSWEGLKETLCQVTISVCVSKDFPTLISFVQFAPVAFCVISQISTMMSQVQKLHQTKLRHRQRRKNESWDKDCSVGHT